MKIPKCLLSENFDLHSWWDDEHPTMKIPPLITRYDCIACLCSYYAKFDDACGERICNCCTMSRWSHRPYIFEGSDKDVIAQRFSVSKKIREDSRRKVPPGWNSDFGFNKKTSKKDS